MSNNKILIDPSESKLRVINRVLRLAMPIILSNLLYTIESAFSIILVSGISATAVAAVGYSASMLWFIYSLMALAYTGTTVLVAQRVGANKDPPPEACSLGMFSLFLLFSLALHQLSYKCTACGHYNARR